MVKRKKNIKTISNKIKLSLKIIQIRNNEYKRTYNLTLYTRLVTHRTLLMCNVNKLI